MNHQLNTTSFMATTSFSILSKSAKNLGFAALFLLISISCKETKSDKAELTALTLTIDGQDYSATINGKVASIKLKVGAVVPTISKATILTISDKATSDIKQGDDLTLTAGTGTITVTAEDGTTTATYTVTVMESTATYYTVTFSLNGGTSATIANQKVEDGGIAKTPLTDPTQIGFIFDGWSKSTTDNFRWNFITSTVTADVTLYARWTPAIYTVTFNLNAEGGVTTPTAYPPVKDVVFGSTVPTPDPAPTRGGFTFDGWFTESTDGTEWNFATAVDANITLHAQWTGVSKEATLLTFIFLATDNPAMALDEMDKQEDITGTVNKTTPYGVTTPEQSAYIYLNDLKATFTASLGATVTVGGVIQASGITENDFTQNITYTVTSSDGSAMQDYVVKITKSKYATIPDANFRAKLKGLVPDAFDGGEQLNIESRDVVDRASLEVGESFIANLKGIEFFKSLTFLICGSDVLTNVNNRLTSLDMSKNTKLTALRCSRNELTSLNVSKNTELTTLYCANNRFKELALDVSANTKLRDFRCGSNISMQMLDVSKNTELTTLYCEYNNLSSLDVSQNTKLTKLFCFGGQLKELNVSQNIELIELECYNNQLTILDMTGMKSITNLIINAGATETDGGNPLTMLKVNEVVGVRQHAKIKEVKMNRGNDVTISTYDNDGNKQCGDYNPIADSGNGMCLD